MRLIPWLLVYQLCLSGISFGQAYTSKVITFDIDNFWTAYDSIRTTSDSLQQLHFIQTLYIDKGSEGLKAFMKSRNYTAELWVRLIRKYPKFWNSIRPNTLSVKAKAPEIDKSIEKLRTLYPGLRPAKLYFTVGALRSGGTTKDSMVLIGTEIATGDPGTDVSEFPTKWLAGVFSQHTTDNIVQLNVHEYIHTQQKAGDSVAPINLLTQSIAEGSADFIAELVIGSLLQNNYDAYGREHEAELKARFKKEMFSTSYSNWLYNGTKAKDMADLGYFMGYTICKSYYNQVRDKQAAIRQIIELNYAQSNAVEHFLVDSKYYPEGFDKLAITKAYDAKRPVVVGILPFSNGDTLVDASLKELTIRFSGRMDTTAISIGYGPGGKEQFPTAGLKGFMDGGTSLVVKLDLKPKHEYAFVVTDLAFMSADGYPVMPLTIKFKTRP
jgi:predicted Zn-dependent protease DUF2268